MLSSLSMWVWLVWGEAFSRITGLNLLWCPTFFFGGIALMLVYLNTSYYERFMFGNDDDGLSLVVPWAGVAFLSSMGAVITKTL